MVVDVVPAASDDERRDAVCAAVGMLTCTAVRARTPPDPDRRHSSPYGWQNVFVGPYGALHFPLLIFMTKKHFCSGDGASRL